MPIVNARAEGAALVAKPTRADLPARPRRKSPGGRLSPTKVGGTGKSGSDFEGASGEGEGEHDSDEDDEDDVAGVKQEMQVDQEIAALS